MMMTLLNRKDARRLVPGALLVAALAGAASCGAPARGATAPAAHPPGMLAATAAPSGTGAAGTSAVGTGATTLPAADRQVSFTVDGTTAYGTVHLPARRPGQRLAAALLLPGSGPTDRNGDQPSSLEPKTLALLAGVLGDQGIMTLRFDKYASGQTGLGAYAGDPGRLDLAAFIRQADAAYALLVRQPEADPGRLLIAGHSEGGMTALLVDESVHPRPAGLALLEPQDLRILDLVRIQLGEQLNAAVKAGQLTAATAAANQAGVSRVIAQFRAGQPVTTTGLLPSVASLFTQDLFSPANARYTRSDDAVYPPSLAARVPAGTRVLVTCGTADQNVPCATLAPELAGLHRAHAAGPGPRVLPGLDHLLHPPGTPAGDAVLAPSAIAAVRTFAAPWADK
jgi:uncharacterized protein